jgi:anaphase-promoting complex subunit 4
VLLRIAYQSVHVPYRGYTEGQCPSEVSLNSAGGEGISSYFAFSHLSGFTPVQMEVHRASKLRGEIPARVCLLGRDKAVYKTYALPEDWS